MLIALSTPVQSTEWFSSASPLNKAHESLLKGDISSSFNAMVEVWQTPVTPEVKENLNSILLQSLDVDCGRTLTDSTLPKWIRSLSLTSQTLESPGRRAFAAILDVNSSTDIRSVVLKNSFGRTVSKDTEVHTQHLTTPLKEQQFNIKYNLTSTLPIGLYEVEVVTVQGDEWSGWIIMTSSSKQYSIRWTGIESWFIQKDFLLNRHCELPVLEVGLYDYIDKKYENVYRQQYESDYPTVLQGVRLPPQRYVLSISMTHQRWQGDIVVAQQQVISKSYDVSDEQKN